MGVKGNYSRGIGAMALLAGAATMAVGGLASSAWATTINIQLGDTSINNTAYTGTGMDTQDTGTTWNYMTTTWAPQSNLVDSSGVATSAGAYVQGNNSGELGGSVVPAYMSGAFWNSQQYASWAGALQMAATISGLTPGQPYELYIYSATPTYAGGTTAIQLASANTPSGGAANLLLDSAGNTTPSLATEVMPTVAAPTAAPSSPNGNWGVLDAVAGGNGDIVFNFYVPSYLPTTDREFLNAVQVQSAVPEPATIGLLAVSGIGILLTVRRRKNV